MKNPKFAYIFLLIFFVIMIIFIMYENFFQPSYWCKLSKEFKESSYRGVVVKKFIDKENHSAKMILIKHNDKIIDMNLDSDTTSYFEYVNVGDSIIKAKESVNLEVIKRNQIKDFSLYFGCK